MNPCGRNPTAADLQKSAARRISLQIAEPGGRHEVRSNPGLQTVARGTGGTEQAITSGLIVLNRASWDSDHIRECWVLLENLRLDLNGARRTRMRNWYIQLSVPPDVPHAASSVRAVVVGHPLAALIIRADRSMTPALSDLRKVPEGAPSDRIHAS